LYDTYILNKISETHRTDKFFARSIVTCSDEVDLTYLQWDEQKKTISEIPKQHLNPFTGQDVYRRPELAAFQMGRTYIPYILAFKSIHV